MDFASGNRWRIRAILDGGPEAIRALLGDKMANLSKEQPDLPWPNLIHSGITALAQKLGHVPEARVTPPHSTESEAPRRRAEKRERIVDAYDMYDRMELQLPQVGRWLPGYGYAVWTVTQRSHEGYVYPCAQLRDPFDSFPGEWGVNQQPEELAISRRIPPLEAKRLYPKYAGEIDQIAPGYSYLGASSGWANQTGRGLEVVEYYDRDGTHILIPSIEARVDFHPNPLSTPSFVVAKRFAFNNLIGQYDHGLGLMGALAKFNILYLTAMEDNVFAPTNIVGDFDGQYKTGRRAVNRLSPGTTVDRPQSNVSYQSGEFLSRTERNLRNIIRYSVQDDGDSPLNFATGAGLDELQATANAEIQEYQKVIRYALQDLDAKRLEWDEAVSPNSKKPLAGLKEGVPKTETYTPSKDIKKAYTTKRVFGIMAGFDDPQKIVAGGQLMTMKLIDRRSLQEKIDGLDDLTLINERIHDDNMRDVLGQALMQAAAQGDQRALMLATEALPEGDPLKTLATKYFRPEGDQVSEEEQAMIGGGPEEQPTDITTVLSRLTGQGQQSGIQTVSTVP